MTISEDIEEAAREAAEEAAQETAEEMLSAEAELHSLGVCFAALKDLDRQARIRVIDWLCARLGISPNRF